MVAEMKGGFAERRGAQASISSKPPRWGEGNVEKQGQRQPRKYTFCRILRPSWNSEIILQAVILATYSEPIVPEQVHHVHLLTGVLMAFLIYFSAQTQQKSWEST